MFQVARQWPSSKRCLTKLYLKLDAPSDQLCVHAKNQATKLAILEKTGPSAGKVLAIGFTRKAGAVITNMSVRQTGQHMLLQCCPCCPVGFPVEDEAFQVFMIREAAKHCVANDTTGLLLWMNAEVCVVAQETALSSSLRPQRSTTQYCGTTPTRGATSVRAKRAVLPSDNPTP